MFDCEIREEMKKERREKFALDYLFDGISTPYGLFDARILFRRNLLISLLIISKEVRDEFS